MKILTSFALALSTSAFVHAADLPPPGRGRVASIDFIFESLYRFFGDDGRGGAILRLHRGRRVNRLELFAADGVGVWRKGDPEPKRVDGQPTAIRMRPQRLVASILLHPAEKGTNVHRIRDVVSEDPLRDQLIFKVGGTVDLAAPESNGQTALNLIEVRETPGANARRPLRYVEAQWPLYLGCADELTERPFLL